MSLIMEGLKRAQQLRTNSLGDEPASGSQPCLRKGNVSFRKKRWIFGTTGLIGLSILIFFHGGFSSPSDTGGSRNAISSPQRPDLPPVRPEEPRQDPIRPPRDSQPNPVIRGQRTDLPKESSPPPQASSNPSARKIPETERKGDQIVKPSAEPGKEEAILLSGFRFEDRGEPQDLPDGRPDGRALGRPEGRPSDTPLPRNFGDISRTDQPEPIEVHPPPDVSFPALKADVRGNERVSLREKTDLGEKAAPAAVLPHPPLSPAPPPRKALQEMDLPAEEKTRSMPIAVRQDTGREKASTSEALRQFNHAVTLHQRRERGGAIEAYRKTIELNPASVEAYNNLGLLYQELGELDQAQGAYQKAVEIAPGYVKGYNNLGVLFLLRGQEDAAMDLFQKALTIDPGHYESHLHLGVLYRKRGQIHKAIESYQKALSIHPSQAEAYYNLGLLYEQLENVGTAARYYRKFIQIASSTYPDLVSRVQRHMDRLLKKQTGKNRE